MENTGRRNSVRRPTQYGGNLQEGKRSTPWHKSLLTAIKIGLLGAAIGVIIPIATVLINASLYSEQFRLGENTPYQIAITLTLWQCSAVFVDMIIAFVAGMRTGRVTGKRWPGLITGATVGAIIECGLLIARFFPGYPEFTINQADNNGWKILIAFLTLPPAWALVGSAIGFCGALVTAHKHPNYRTRREA